MFSGIGFIFGRSFCCRLAFERPSKLLELARACWDFIAMPLLGVFPKFFCRGKDGALWAMDTGPRLSCRFVVPALMLNPEVT